jgi:hypothetical protein
LKEIGHYPQFAAAVSKINFYDKNHYYQQQPFEALPIGLYKPDLVLRPKARLSDKMGGASPMLDIVVSQKALQVLQQNNDEFVEYHKVTLLDGAKEFDYYFVHPIKSCEAFIDFSKTQVSIYETTWDEKEKVWVKTYDEFVSLVQSTEAPYWIRIRNPIFREGTEAGIFFCKHTAYCQAFCSARLKEAIETNHLTGFQFVPAHMIYEMR